MYQDKAQYAVIAKKKFSGVEAKVQAQRFGISHSEDYLWALLEAALTIDVEFRRKYLGWSFLVVRIDQCIDVTEDGCVRIHRNERMPVAIAQPTNAVSVGVA